jgi:hypothetical protein
MISGGDHLEYPTELESDKEMEMEQAFDEAMWEWVLEQGPPQDDDVVWLKDHAWNIGFHEGLGELSSGQGETKLEAL